MLIDYSRILTNDSKMIPDVRIQDIKARAEREARKFRSKHLLADIAMTLSKKADEYAYISSANNDLTTDEKALLSANIMFSNQRMAELLLNGDFDKDTLKIYMDVITFIKRKLASDSVNCDLEKYKLTAEKYTRRLIKYFRNQVGVVNANQIINKIYEIMTYEPTLLDTDTKSEHR